jgi:CheY-like chemotaxis protein
MPAGTVLVIEDDVLIRLAVADHLRHCGYDLLEAQNGQKAIRLLDDDGPVDVVFPDVQMPGAIDGFGAVRWLREHRPKLPVVIASGHAMALELASKLCDVRSVFAKPYDEARVVAAVAELLSDRTAVSSSAA